MLPKPYESVRVKEFPRPCAGEEFYRVGKEGAKFLNPKALYAYYERHPELEDVYLKQDRMFRKREKELWCRATLSGSQKHHFIIANFSRKKAQSHLNDTVMPLFLHSFSSVPGY